MGLLPNTTRASTGSVTPVKSDKAGWGAGFVTNKDQNAKPDCAGPTAQAQASREKAFATLRARLALTGWTLIERSGNFVVAQWGRSRELATLDAVEAFAHQVGVP